MTDSAKVLSTPLDELEVSPATAGFLQSLGIETLAELLELQRLRAKPLVLGELNLLFEELGVSYSGELVQAVRTTSPELFSIDFQERKRVAVSFADLLAVYFDQAQSGRLEFES